MLSENVFRVLALIVMKRTIYWEGIESFSHDDHQTALQCVSREAPDSQYRVLFPLTMWSVIIPYFRDKRTVEAVRVYHSNMLIFTFITTSFPTSKQLIE